MSNKINMNEEITLLLKRIVIDKLDSVTVMITNKNISFSYTIADAVVKDEYKGKYKYFGGLQCNYEHGSEMYNLLEKRLCLIAEKVLEVSATYC